MSDLGDLLELIHDAHARLSTLEAEYRDWIKLRPSFDLSIERSELGTPRMTWRGGGPFPVTLNATRRIWLREPNCLRIEVVDGRELIRLGVRDGARWLCWDRVDGVVRGDVLGGEDAGSRTLPRLLSLPLVRPARLLSAMWFERAEQGTRAGREVVVAQARLRRPSEFTQVLSHEFEFDAEHGTILRRAVFDDGEAVSLTEAITVRYQVPVEPRRFDLVEPPIIQHA